MTDRTDLHAMNLVNPQRRRVIAGSAIAGASLALPGALRSAFAQAPITVGVIYVGPRDDFGYNQAHAEAAAQLKKMAGIKVVEEENVPETQAVQKSMQGMIAQDGATLLFPTSFGYFDPHILAVAPKYPEGALRPLRRAVERRPSTRRMPAASSATSTRRST